MKILMLLVLLLSGCATIMGDETTRVSVTGVPSADFKIKNKIGDVVESGTTPRPVTLENSAGYFEGEHYTVHFSKPGYVPVTRVLDSELNDWYFGNIIFGGVLGLVIVDPLTGSMWELPKHIDVQLQEK